MSGGGGGSIKETSAQKASTEVAIKGWEDFKTRWRPAQNAYFSRVLNNYSGTRKMAAGTAANDVDVAFGNAAGDASAALQRRGIGIGGGMSAATVNDMDIKRAASRGLATVAGKQAADDQQQQAIEGIVATGRGEKAAATAGLSALSNLSAQSAANEANIRANNSAAFGNAVGTVAGAGLGAATNRFTTLTDPNNLNDAG